MHRPNLHRPGKQAMIRYTMLAFWGLTVGSAAMVFGQTTREQPQHAAEPTSAHQIEHDATVLIPLPVFIGSLIGTAGLTWKVAKYDSKKDREIQQLKDAVAALQKKGQSS